MSEAERVVRESIEAFDRADWEELERAWDPDGVIVAPAAWPEGGSREGWPAIREQFERLKADWSEDHIEVEASVTVRPDLVLTRARWHGVGAASGLPFDGPIWMLATVRDGKLVRAEYFLDERSARAAAERVAG